MSRVFVSHATADKVLIDPFVDLLHVGLNLKQNDIFCTSLEGMGIPRGSNFADFIRKQFKASDFVIMVITPKYYESAFCLCELGATWITGSDAIPLLVPPLDYEDLKAVLSGVQAGYINDKRALNELRDRLIAAKIASGATDRWESKRDTFIKSFTKIKGKLEGRDSVSAVEHEKLKKTYEEAQETIVERDEAIDQLKERIGKLERLKDREGVKDVRRKYSTEQEQFDELVQNFIKSAKKLPPAGVEVLFHENCDSSYVLRDRFGYRDEWEDAEDAKKDGYVTISENVVSRNESNPKMENALDALHELGAFMEKASEEFSTEFVEEHEIQFSLDSREFWTEVFEL